MITSNQFKLMNTLLRSKKTLLFIVFLISVVAGAQTFALQVTPTPETCAGNGTLTFSTSGAQATVNYKIYKLPNTTSVIYNGPAGTLSGQQAGNYKVVASQTVNGTTQTVETTSEIINQVTFFVFTAQATDAVCGNDGIITATVTSGTAIAYEIISGPVTVPPQNSNVFNNLPAGFYIIKATDACGSAPVVSLNVFSEAPVLSISSGQLPDADLPDCNLITVRNSVTHLTAPEIAYPLTVTYTVYPPDGSASISYNQTITTGDGDYQDIDQVITFYYDTPYYYDITVIDPCGNRYPKLQNLVDASLNVFLNFETAGCGKIALLVADKFVPPFTAFFSQAPTGFIPANFNTAYPGPLTSPLNIFGSDQNGIPNGTYQVTITDACGRTATVREELTPDPDPFAATRTGNSDCINNLGWLEIAVAERILGVVTLTSAPQAYLDLYGASLSQDLSLQVRDIQGIKLEGLPPGTYVFDLYDTCGFHYTPVTTIIVPDYTLSTIVVLQRQDCAPGMGTIMLTKNLTAARIVTAPAAYTQTLPQDLSGLIDADGDIYLENMPPGQYTFSLTNACEGTVTKNLALTGNEVSRNDFSYTPYCGSFDLEMYHTATPSSSVRFWLQREYGNGTGIWGHPDGSATYTGTQINTLNSTELTNNTITYTLMYPTGHYRVLKTYRSFSSTQPGGVKDCMDVIYDFSYYNDLKNLKAEILTCGGSASDVKISAEGVQPLTYTITHKNGIPFSINNNTNSIFTNLDAAIYTVRVQDPCGHDETLVFNVANLPPPVTAFPAADLTQCDAGNDTVESFNLAQQDDIIRGNQPPATVSITYHYTLSDAAQGLNETTPDITITGITTIYARVTLISNPACYAITAFRVVPLHSPQLSMAERQHGCEGQPNAITADSGYISYEWSTGETMQTIYPEHAGDYTVTVTNNNLCTSSKTISLSTTAPAQIQQVDISDWTDKNNVISVTASAPGASQENIEYSLDNHLWQESNIFTGLPAGKYTVYVRDKSGCGGDGPVTTYLLTYPKYFTPNGDNTNETWRIRFSSVAEPGLMVYIYDRFGKLITGFGTDSEGWDGTLNGSPLPSTDYWFVVRRQDSKEYRGHFALIR